MKRYARQWSKLQKRLYKLISDDINFQIHCVVYPMKSNHGKTGLPRYFITFDKNIIWDYPADFIKADSLENDEAAYPYSGDVSTISDLIAEYINTGNDELSEKVFENDLWNLTDILKASDRRIGIRRLNILKENTKQTAVLNIINKRLII